MKLTGIMSTMAVDDDGTGDHANVVAPGLAAPYHQHLFNVRLDVEVDGPDNAVFEVDAVGRDRRGPRRTRGATPSGATATLLESERRPSGRRITRAAGAGGS